MSPSPGLGVTSAGDWRGKWFLMTYSSANVTHTVALSRSMYRDRVGAWYWIDVLLCVFKESEWRRGRGTRQLGDMELHTPLCATLLLLLGLTTGIALARNLGECLSHYWLMLWRNDINSLTKLERQRWTLFAIGKQSLQLASCSL
jgi:hypothetical protein